MLIVDRYGSENKNKMPNVLQPEKYMIYQNGYRYRYRGGIWFDLIQSDPSILSNLYPYILNMQKVQSSTVYGRYGRGFFCLIALIATSSMPFCARRCGCKESASASAKLDKNYFLTTLIKYLNRPCKMLLIVFIPASSYAIFLLSNKQIHRDRRRWLIWY